MAAERETPATIVYEESAFKRTIDDTANKAQNILDTPDEQHTEKVDTLRTFIDRRNQELASCHIIGSKAIVYGVGFLERPSEAPIPLSSDVYGTYKGLVVHNPKSRAGKPAKPPRIFHAVTAAYSIEPLSITDSLRGLEHPDSSESYEGRTILVPLEKTWQLDVLDSPGTRQEDQDTCIWLQGVEYHLGRIREDRLTAVQRAARIFDIAVSKKQPRVDYRHQREIDLALDRMERYFAISGKPVEIYADEAAAVENKESHALPRNIHPFKGILLGLFDMEGYEKIFPKKNVRYSPHQSASEKEENLPPVLGIALESEQNGHKRLLHIPARACSRIILNPKR